MKKLLVAALALMLVGSVSYSQDVAPNLAGGSKALLFGFGGLSNLNANNYAGGFGVKYYLSSSMAVRGLLQFASSSTATPPTPPPGAGEVGADATTSSTTIGVGGAVELHLATGRVSPYIGAGVAFSTISTESKTPYSGPPPVVQTVTKNANGSTNFTVFGMVGFEFFLWKEISLGGEYQLGFTSSSAKDTEVTSGATTTTFPGGSSSNFGIGATGTLTLAVYL